jgi:hypothetical protein
LTCARLHYAQQTSLRRRQANRFRVLKFGAIALVVLFAAMFGTVAVSSAHSHDTPSTLLSSAPLLGLGCLMFRDKPDDSAGGGNSDTPPAWAPSAEAPAITGDNLEQKVEKATGIIGTLFGHLKSAYTAFKELQGSYKTLEGQFNSLKETAQAEKDAHVATKGLLSDANTKVAGLTTERDKATKNVERLEGLCALKGIDHTAVVPPANQPEAAADNTPAGKWAKYQALRTDENAGKVDPGTAQAFWRENKADLNKYAQSQRTKQS